MLAPDHVGVRADLTTTPPGRTIEVPGGTRALQRSERITVQVAGRTGLIPRPDLVGAMLVKLAATGLPGDPARMIPDVDGLSPMERSGLVHEESSQAASALR